MLRKLRDQLTAYLWSSLIWHGAAPEDRPGWVRVDRLLGGHGIGEDTAAGRARFEQRLERSRLAEAGGDLADEVDGGASAFGNVQGGQWESAPMDEKQRREHGGCPVNRDRTRRTRRMRNAPLHGLTAVPKIRAMRERHGGIAGGRARVPILALWVAALTGGLVSPSRGALIWLSHFDVHDGPRRA